jgi:2-oxo-4-hydroxy-4-carboxy--5-ureidoimidazoline (OHCU) decarboxylase
MAAISGIGVNPYSSLINPVQNNSQSSTAADPIPASMESTLSTLKNAQNSEVVSLLQANSGLAQTALDTTSSLPSLESLSATLSNLQSIEQSDILQTNPDLAQSVLESTLSPASLESLSATMSNLQSIGQSNILQTNPNLAQSIIQGNTAADDSTGSLINTTA